MKVHFTPTARRQLLLAVAYLADQNPAAAIRFHARVERSLRRIERFPASGRSLPEYPELPHREVMVRPYRLVYRVEGRRIWVVAVWHGAQRPRRPTFSPD